MAMAYKEANIIANYVTKEAADNANLKANLCGYSTA